MVVGGDAESITAMTTVKAENSPEEKGTNLYTPGEKAVDITESKDGGILKEIIKEGHGEDYPRDGEKAVVHYVGQLPNGEIFDSSRPRGEAFEFVLGKGAVIKGWEIGIPTMKKGEIAMLTCNPDYAYGKNGMPPSIPGDSTLIFEVELIDWKLEDLTSQKDGGILRRILKKGEGFTSPNDDASVEVHLLGRLNNTVFEDRDVTFSLGEGSDAGIVEGIELALRKFKKEEESLIRLSSKYAYGKDGKPELNIPPDADLEYEVTLKNFEKTKESWEMDSVEKLEQAEIAKNKGTNLFKAEKYKLSVKQYKKVISFLEHENAFEGEDKKKRDSLMLASHLNLAMCYLKMDNYLDATKACNEALGMDPDNVKGLFRRGQAKLTVNDYEEAKQDFEHLLKVEPNNKAARNQLILCNNKIKEYLDKERETYRSMFLSMEKKDKNNLDNGVETGVWNNNKEKSESDEMNEAVEEIVSA